MPGNLGFLFWDIEHGDRRRTPENAVGFAALLSDFYADAGFARFFEEQASLRRNVAKTMAAREALNKSNGDAASAMPKSALLNRVCAMQTHRTESPQEPQDSALTSGSRGCGVAATPAEKTNPRLTGCRPAYTLA